VLPCFHEFLNKDTDETAKLVMGMNNENKTNCRNTNIKKKSSIFGKVLGEEKNCGSIMVFGQKTPIDWRLYKKFYKGGYRDQHPEIKCIGNLNFLGIALNYNIPIGNALIGEKKPRGGRTRKHPRKTMTRKHRKKHGRRTNKRRITTFR